MFEESIVTKISDRVYMLCTVSCECISLSFSVSQFYWTGNCSFGMDIWQAGCSVLYMITGRRPWRHLCMDVDKSRATPSQAATMKKDYCQLVRQHTCLM